MDEINIDREPYLLPLSPGGLDDDDGSEQMEEHSPTLAPIADAPAGPPGKKKGRGKGNKGFNKEPATRRDNKKSQQKNKRRRNRRTW